MGSDLPTAASRLVLDTFDESRFEDAVADLHHRLGGPADLCFLFLSPGWLPHLSLVLELTQIGLRCPRISGCTTSGLVADGGEYENVSGASLLALRLPGTRIERNPWPQQPGFWDEVAMPADACGAILLANPIHLPVDSFLNAWNARSPLTPTYGGFASGGATEDQLALFTENGICHDAVLATHFIGPLRLIGAVGQSCRPIGTPYTVTGADGNVVTSLGGLAPMRRLEEAFQAYLSESGSEQDLGPGLLHAGFPASERDSPDTHPEAGGFLIRAIIGADPGSGAMAVAGLPRVGQTLQFQLRDPLAASRYWQSALEKLHLPAPPLGGLLFPCVARGTDFFDQPDHDAALCRASLGPFPAAGAMVNGELAPVAGHLHAHTFGVSAVFFVPAQDAP